MVQNNGTVMDVDTISEKVDEVKLRPINCELNPLTRVDGSALFAMGGTSVIASMLGPIEVRIQNLNIEESHVECVYRALSAQSSTKDKIRENMIKEACQTAILTTLHPRTTISIQIQELDNRSGLEACAVNAACLALLIGGVPLKFTIAGVHCIINKHNKLILDPDRADTIGAMAGFTFVYDSLNRDVVTIQTNGHFKMTQLVEAEQMCRVASGIIFDFYRKVVSQFHAKSLLTSLPETKTSKQQRKEKEKEHIALES